MVAKFTPSQDIEILYTDHHRWLRGWLSRKLGDAFIAADLAQDTFLRLLARDSMPLIREPRAMLTTIANGLVTDHWRRERIEQAYADTLALQPEACAPSTEERAILIETLLEIDRILAGLPRLVRQVFLMSQLDEMKQSDIARHLGISVPTVKRYVAKAIQHCCFA